MPDIPLMTYVATMSVTPGPNNIMLAASGVNFGLRRTVPMMLGVSLGHAFQVLLVGITLTWITAWLETLRPVMVATGCTYLLWLAWRQAHAARPGAEGKSKPVGFMGMALFQWINPKAWMMVLNVAILFLPVGSTWQDVLLLAMLCASINLPCIALWAVTGDRLREQLNQPSTLNKFNYLMAVLLAGTALWIGYDELGLMMG